MVAHQQHHLDVRRGEPLHPPGELALLGGAGVFGLVDVAGHQKDVGVLRQREVDHLVEAAQVVLEAVMEPRGGVPAAVVLHADVQVGRVNDANGLPLLHERPFRYALAIRL
ncbi:hypothetical protein D3C78_1701620 [compost metagenome]